MADERAAPRELQEALKNVITFREPMMPGFATIRIEMEIHDVDGNTLPAQIHFLDQDGAVYGMTDAEKVTDTKFIIHTDQYVTTDGKPLTFFDLLDLVCADKTLSEYIDADAIQAIMNKSEGAAHAAPSIATSLFKIPTATAIRAESLEYPLDKVNSQIWSLLEKDTGGQIAIKAEKVGSKKELNIYYAIDFDEIGQEITITRRLTPFDKRVYIAISALFNAGNKTITLTQIYYAMGYTGRPGASDLERINAAITKMTSAKVYVNNEQEASAYKYQQFIYDGPLLPLERGTAIVNGQLAEAAIHIFREPPVITFAKQRKQITTIGVDLLQSPISKTDKNLLIDDYLIERISRAKNGKQPRRILLKTLYERVGVTSSKQKQRMPDKIKRYLSHYQKCGMIETFSIDHEGISFSFK